MKVAFRNHDGKGTLLGEALLDAGYELVTSGGDVALVDADLPVKPYEGLCNSHDRVLVYPHGGGNPFVGDHWPVHPNTVGRFVPGQGQADILASAGYPRPVETIGWPFSERRDFRPCQAPLEVLFAPMHPLYNKWLPDGAAESNRRVHDMLADLPINLTVRFLDLNGHLRVRNYGIARRSTVNYVPAVLDVNDGPAAIAKADVVIGAEGTFPSLAIALGCPTLMSAQQQAGDDQLNGVAVKAKSLDYAKDAAYPFDADSCANPSEMMDMLITAARDDAPIAEWRDRFVGDQFDGVRFLDAFERLLT